MILGHHNNTTNPHSEFETILQNSAVQLIESSKKDLNFKSLYDGTKLEALVYNVMVNNAISTSFHNNIELIGGSKFPDIKADTYGVEVKSTTKSHWKTTGNSVLESSRIENIENIYMFFGKLGGEIDFKWRPYEECLYEIAVTHSPRYLIDMNLAEGDTIFDKINKPYNDLRLDSNPLKYIVDFYRQKGMESWWINEAEPTSFAIKIWSSLSIIERNKLKIELISLFPEIIKSKFERASIWLIKKHSIACHNLRDQFTAGGKVLIEDEYYPKIIAYLYENIEIILDHIEETDIEKLSYAWDKPVSKEWKKKIYLNLLHKYLKPDAVSLLANKLTA